MTSRRLTRQSSDDVQLNLVQDHVLQVVNPVLAIPLLDGVLIEGVALTTSYQNISHTLGRPWRGYIVVRHPMLGAVTNEPSADDSKFLRLVSSAAGTVSLWVF